MVDYSLSDLIGQIQSLPIFFQEIDHPQALLVVAEIRQELGKCHLTRVPEWGVPQIVTKSDRLDEIVVQSQGTPNRSGNLGDFDRVSEASSVVITGWGDEDLSLVHQPAKRFGMYDPV